MEAGSPTPHLNGNASSVVIGLESFTAVPVGSWGSDEANGFIAATQAEPDSPRTTIHGNIINRRVLILNQNYEPLTICNVKRALALSFRGAVAVVESHSFLRVRAVRDSFPVPSVVRLERYIHTPIRNVILNRRNLLIRDGHRCMYCGIKTSALTIDHIIPRQKGGEDTWENLVCACPRCNGKKGDRTPERAGMKLLKKPKKPHQINFIRQFATNADPAWRQYLFME